MKFVIFSLLKKVCMALGTGKKESHQYVGFNIVQKLPTYKFLNKENKQCESITHKTHM